MEIEKLIETLKSKGIITQKDTNQLIMRSTVDVLLKELQKEWIFSSDLESGGHFMEDSDLVDIYFIYDISVYDASNAKDKAKKIIKKKDKNKLIMRSTVDVLLKELQKEWIFSSDLESGGHFMEDSDLVDIYFIYDTSVYDASTATDEAKKILTNIT